MRNEEFNAPGFSHRWKGTRLSKALMRKEEFHAPGFSYCWKGRGFLFCGVNKSVGASPGGGVPHDELGTDRDRAFFDEERRKLDFGLILDFSRTFCPFACQETLLNVN